MVELIRYIRKDWGTFFSNVVLGFNDALISLTGALVGFAFALPNARVVAVAGLVTGLSASMSMAASAYQQARYEKGRNALKAALFTGLSYLGIAVLLVAPFLVNTQVTTALWAMAGIAVLVIAGISFHSARLLKRCYILQFIETCAFSLGVSAVTFFIGQVLSRSIGI